MTCMERNGVRDMELFKAINDIVQLENEKQRYKAMYVIWDVAQRLKRKELNAFIDQAEVFADYGIIIKDGKISDWGNTDIDVWKNKLIMNGGLKGEQYFKVMIPKCKQRIYACFNGVKTECQK